MIRIRLNANFGIFNFRPLKVATEIVSIGPSIQAKGTFRCSATKALGKEIINMVKKFSEKRSLKFSLFIGSASIFFIKY